MKLVSKIGLFVAAALVLSLSSCLPDNDYPDTPVIKYVSFTKHTPSSGVDDTGTLTFSFTDGDGDIGLAQGDTLPPYDPSSQYYYNFFTKYYEKKNGQFEEVVLDPPNYFRIPVLTPEGQNKTLEGDIEVVLYINNPFSEYDTIKFEAWIVDRSLKESNVITTEEIVVQK